MPEFDWDYTTVVAGAQVTVRVTDAPCHPITVKLMINGGLVSNGTVPEAPGQVTLSVPSGTQNKPYEIIVSCNGQSDSDSGTVG
jgi:hypothetical protein